MQTFIKLTESKMVKELLKEAKRVKYTVENNGLTFRVEDENKMVFKGVRVNAKAWACTFNKAYWQEG